jgi:hypothetical protein
MAEIDDIHAQLRRDDDATREDRAQRLAEIRRIFPSPEDGAIVFGGSIASWAFQDARQAYIAALWFPAIITCLTAITHDLAGRLYAAGVNEAVGMTLPSLIETAATERIIDSTEAQDLLAIHERGKLYHSFDEPVALAKRMVDAGRNGMDEWDMQEDDARFIVTVTGQYYHRHCALGRDVG